MKKIVCQKGFTLVEVVISMLILTIGIVASMGMIRSARSGMQSGNNMTVAIALAQAKMEERRAISYDDLLSGPRFGEETIDGYTRKWTVRMNSPQNQTSVIGVSIEWSDGRRQTHRLNLGSVVSEGVVP